MHSLVGKLVAAKLAQKGLSASPGLVTADKMAAAQEKIRRDLEMAMLYGQSGFGINATDYAFWSSTIWLGLDPVDNWLKERKQTLLEFYP